MGAPESAGMVNGHDLRFGLPWAGPTGGFVGASNICGR
jgi:hypothetical protein